MEWIFQWVQNITYYLVLMGLVSNLLPDTRYERYIKLFCGVVFILLVTSPLTAGLKLDKTLADIYRGLCLEGDAKDTADLEDRLWKIQAEQTERVFAQYEEAVSQDIRAMAEEAGFACPQVRARIERRGEAERFGQVVDVELVLGQTPQAEPEGAGPEGDAAEVAVGDRGGYGRVDPVQIRVELGGERADIDIGGQDQAGLEGRRADIEGQIQAGLGGGRSDTDIEEAPEDPLQEREAEQAGGKEQEAFDGFQRKVAAYYGLEEKAVRITWQDD